MPLVLSTFNYFEKFHLNLKNSIEPCLYVMLVAEGIEHFSLRDMTILTYNINLYTGRIQCEVLTTLPFCFSWIKKFLGQQSKI